MHISHNKETGAISISPTTIEEHDLLTMLFVAYKNWEKPALPDFTNFTEEEKEKHFLDSLYMEYINNDELTKISSDKINEKLEINNLNMMNFGLIKTLLNKYWEFNRKHATWWPDTREKIIKRDMECFKKIKENNIKLAKRFPEFVKTCEVFGRYMEDYKLESDQTQFDQVF